MSGLLDLLLFLLGVHVAIRLVAALYRVIDLWFVIRASYPRVIAGLLLWIGVAVVVAMWLPESRQPAFLWGVVAFPPFYLGLYLARPLFIRRRAAPPSL